MMIRTQNFYVRFNIIKPISVNMVYLNRFFPCTIRIMTIMAKFFNKISSQSISIFTSRGSKVLIYKSRPFNTRKHSFFSYAIPGSIKFFNQFLTCFTRVFLLKIFNVFRSPISNSGFNIKPFCFRLQSMISSIGKYFQKFLFMFNGIRFYQQVYFFLIPPCFHSNKYTIYKGGLQ